MPALVSKSRALLSAISRRYDAGSLVRQHRRYDSMIEYCNLRCLSCISGGDNASRSGLLIPSKGVRFPPETLPNAGNLQRRRFLGCGDGEEGGVLSKVYEERRILGYSPEQLFDVVAAVDFYQDFVPWCQRSEIVKTNPDGSFDAELEIGFKFLVESYVSHVEMNRPNLLKTTVSDSTLFDHLINVWEFSPGPTPGSCDLHFLVDFKFRSPLYRQVASVFFKEVVERLVGSFSERCRVIYGPAVPILERPA